jgi:hypothetical protein
MAGCAKEMVRWMRHASAYRVVGVLGVEGEGGRRDWELVVCWRMRLGIHPPLAEGGHPGPRNSGDLSLQGSIQQPTLLSSVLKLIANHSNSFSTVWIYACGIIRLIAKYLGDATLSVPSI